MKAHELRTALADHGVTVKIGHLAGDLTVLHPTDELQDHLVTHDTDVLNNTALHRGLFVSRRGVVWVLSGHQDLTASILEDGGNHTQAQQAALEALGKVLHDTPVTVDPDEPDDEPEPPPVKAPAKARRATKKGTAR